MITTEEFAALPLDDQIETLEAALGAGAAADEALALCASVRDHAPLAWLCGWLVAHDGLAEGAARARFAAFLLGQPETAVHRVVQAMLEGPQRPAQREHVRDTLLSALEQVGIDRLSSMCLIDRALKHNFQDDRDAHVREVVARVEAALARGEAEGLPLAWLAQVPGRTVARLREVADGAGCAAAFDARRALLAQEAITTLNQAPKAISQANAEELLSRRVYTDPGHFLIELLQNAEDAGAKTWRVIFDADRLLVWHDGKPFDARDLVGVTSIGQTTKRKSQIGFFGVGFKSVYEVTARPQIYSDVFQFEIADVSIPKLLRTRPAELPQEGTLLILPLRDPDDRERSPRALYDKARALDPCVLFTLRGIDILELELTARATGGPRAHKLVEQPPDAYGRSIIEDRQTGERTIYLVQDQVYRYDGGQRAAGRPDETRVMVGVRLDEAGVPVALPTTSATVYSYLPTDERSGLRFFVQGHFDVPVDRERVTPESPWNRWILSHVPEQLARLAERLLAPEVIDHARVADALLALLPRVEELPAPDFHVIPERLPEALRAVSVVPCLDGQLRPASQVLLAPPEVLALCDADTVLDGAALNRHALPQLRSQPVPEGALALAHPLCTDRALEQAERLGARVMDTGMVLAALTWALTEAPERGPFAQARRGDPEAVVALYGLLDARLDDLQRAGQSVAASAILAQLKRLPLVPDDQGVLHPAAEVASASQALREVYGAQRVFLHPALDRLTEDSEEEADALHPLLVSLGVGRLQSHDLLAELEAAFGQSAEPRADLSDIALLPDQAAVDRLARVMLDAPWPVLKRLGRLPVFFSDDGRWWRASRDSMHDPLGCLLPPEGPHAAALLAFYATARPVLAVTGPVADLLARLSAPALGLDVLLADLGREDFLEGLTASTTASAERVQGRLLDLHALLAAAREELSDRHRHHLAALSIWPDASGTPRALRGPERALLPSHPALTALFPDAPFLHPALRELPHVGMMGVDRLGASAVLDALSPDAQPPLHLSTEDPDTLERAHAFLIEHGERLGRKGREQIASLPILLDDQRRPRKLTQLWLATPELREAIGAHADRAFIDASGSSWALLERFDLASRVARLEPRGIVDALRHDPDAWRADPEGLERAWLALARHADALDRRALDHIATLDLLPDGAGGFGAAGDWEAPGDDPDAQLWLADEALTPLLTAAGLRTLSTTLGQGDASTSIQELLRAAGRGPLTLRRLWDIIPRWGTLRPGQAGHPLQRPDALAVIHALLVTHKDALRGASIDAWSVWLTRAGGVTRGRELVRPGALPELLGDGDARALLDDALARHEAEDALRALDDHIKRRAPGALLAALIPTIANDDAPLTAQPHPLSTLRRLSTTLGLIHGHPGAAEGAPLLDATGSLTTTRALMQADEATLALLQGTPLQKTLVHPELSEAARRLYPSRCVALDHAQVLDALASDAARVEDHPLLADAARRAHLYAWMLAHQRALLSDPACRERIARSRLIPTERGSLPPVRALAFDADLPDLGVDWRPAEELPEALAALLVRHLDLGASDLSALAHEHLLPAYHQALQTGDLPRAAALLHYLARRTASRSAEDAHALCHPPQGAPMRLPDRQGRPCAPVDLHLAPEHLSEVLDTLLGLDAPTPHPTIDTPEARSLLLKLGVRPDPTLRTLRLALERPGSPSLRRAVALATLIAQLARLDEDALLNTPQLATIAWAIDAHGMARRPNDLFIATLRTRQLIGDAPELFAAEPLTERLGDELARRLGFKTALQVQLPDVTAHLRRAATTRTPVAMTPYVWMEAGLREGWIAAEALRRELDGHAWVFTDDEAFFDPQDVLGRRELQRFGARRGYWSLGARECARLCQVFGIEERPTAAFTARFLRQIAAEVARRGDLAVLAEDSALPRMLQANFAALAEAPIRLERDLALIPCVERAPDADTPPRLRLLPANTPSLLRSDTPTLEAMFHEAGTLHLAAMGPRETLDGVDRFYARHLIRRLREAFSVSVDASRAGRDVTEAHAAHIQRLRQSLRGLLAVLPRVERQRGGPPHAWVYHDRLSALATSGKIRTLEGLRVTYTLEGVGSVDAQVDAAFDPSRQEYLVDARCLRGNLAESATGLALGLMSCIYDGPDEDQLVDIIVLLLPMPGEEAMHAYLNRRHYPTVVQQRAPSELLAERLGELLDFGLDRRLAARFEVFEGRALAVWRGAELPRQLMEGLDTLTRADRDRWAAPVARGLLAAVDLDAAAHPELHDALQKILAAPSLDAIPPEVLATESRDAIDAEAFSRGDTPPSTLGPTPSPDRAPTAPGAPLPKLSLDAKDAAQLTRDILDDLATLADDEALTAARQALRPQGQAPDADAQGEDTTAPAPVTLPPEEVTVTLPDAADTPLASADTIEALLHALSRRDARWTPDTQPTTHDALDAADLRPAPLAHLLPKGFGEATPQHSAAPEGVWSRVRRLFGAEDASSAPAPAEAPAWADDPSANPMTPEGTIRPQLWVTPEHLRRMSGGEAPAIYLDLEPASLPLPHLYALHTLGATFRRDAQTWTPDGAPSHAWLGHAEPSGREVIARGVLPPGLTQLPIPMHARLSAPPTSPDPAATLHTHGRADGSVWVEVQADGPVPVHMALDLLTPPLLTDATEAPSPSAALKRPTLALEALPAPLRRWILHEARIKRPAWQTALAAQAFVRKHYVYDLEFMERPEVVAARRALVAGQGHHHIELLHASAGGGVLGRGICYELNSLLVEVLRHLGIAAMAATCWVLDGRRLTAPSHLIAAAILPGDRGPTLVPLDGAATESGPQHLGALPARPRAATSPSSLPSIAAPSGVWASLQASAPPQQLADDALSRAADAQRAETIRQLDAMRRVVLHVHRAAQDAPPEALTAALRDDLASLYPAEARAHIHALQQHATAHLGDAALVGALALVARGELREVAVLPLHVRELVRRQLLTVRPLPRFEVRMGD